MSDDELEAIRRSKLLKLQKAMNTKKEKEIVHAKPDPNTILNRIFKGRAWEVFQAATYQYPNVMVRIKNALVDLASSGKLKELTGEQLYLFLKNIGLKVRLKTKISFTKQGKLKSLAEKIREDIQEM